MAGILIIAHTPLASALKACVVHIYGEEPVRMEALDILPRDDPAHLVEIAREQVIRLGRRRGTLVLTDLLGGTPSNIASQLASLPNVRVIAGANLPMLVRTLCYRDRAMPLNTLVQKALTGGMQGIQLIESNAARTAMPLQKNGYENPCLLGTQHEY